MPAKKLDAIKVKKVKIDLANKMTQPEAAKKYDCSRSTISDIATGRIWTSVPWPEGYFPKKKSGGQHKKLPLHDPTDSRVLELESEVLHLTEERNRERQKNKANSKTQGLFKAIVEEMELRVKPMEALPTIKPLRVKDNAIVEHVVMHNSDGHCDQVVTLDDSQGLEEYNFNIACARAERYVDTVIDWCKSTLSPTFDFTTLWIPCYGDHTSGEIHNHGPRSYYRNQFKNCLGIAQLHSLMIRDLAPYFKQVNVLYLSGNHGRRSKDKDHYGAQNNFDYLIGEIARLHCRDMSNVNFLIPNSYSINVDINGVGFNFSHGDDVRSNGGVPFYGMLKRQNGIVALGNLTGRHTRYSVMGHHHTASSLSTIGDSELLVNGAWIGTDPYVYNEHTSYREPTQLLHGVNPKYGITWKMNVKLKHESEKKGPKRYKIDGGRDVGPIWLPT